MRFLPRIFILLCLTACSNTVASLRYHPTIQFGLHLPLQWVL